MISLYRLPNGLPEEKIIKIIRRDLFILFKKVVFFAFISLVPVVFFEIFSLTNPNIWRGELAYSLLVVGGSAYYLFAWLFFFFSFIDYYLDVWIITSQRIIDVKQNGFFSRVVAEQRLSRVQDVASEEHGFFPTILKYGNVYVQTAGESQKITLEEVPNPSEVRFLIARMAAEVRNEGDKV